MTGKSSQHDTGDNYQFDLEERTTVFAERIVEFADKLKKDGVSDRIVNQLVGAGTSIGSNYCEADDAESREDFMHKIGIAKKEARETKFFLRLAAKASSNNKEEARQLWNEAKELHLILNSIYRNTKARQPNKKN